MSKRGELSFSFFVRSHDGMGSIFSSVASLIDVVAIISDGESIIMGNSQVFDVLPKIIELSVSIGAIAEGAVTTIGGVSGLLSITSSVPMDSDSLMIIIGSCCTVHSVFGVG